MGIVGYVQLEKGPIFAHFYKFLKGKFVNEKWRENIKQHQNK